MSTGSKKRLSRLRDELDDIQQDYQKFTLDIITCTTKLPLIRTSNLPLKWNDREQDILLSEFGYNDKYEFDINAPSMLPTFDPLPDRKSCLLWNDFQFEKNDIGSKELIKWANKCLKFLKNNPDLCSKFEIKQNIKDPRELILLFFELSKKVPELFKSVEGPSVFKLSTYSNKEYLPRYLQKIDPPPEFANYTIEETAPIFITKILNHFGELPSGPRITVNVEEGYATFDGIRYKLDTPYIWTLDLLVQAKGNPITRRRMKELDPRLKDEIRLGRDVVLKIKDNGCRDIGLLIESCKTGYRIPEEFL